MADTAKRLAGPAYLATSAATLYTVPASTTTVVREMFLANETASESFFTVSIGTDGAGKRIYKSVRLPANSTLHLVCWLVLTAGEVIQGWAADASAVSITISGVEST